MSDWSDIKIEEDPLVRQNWAELLRPRQDRTNSKGLVLADQVLFDFVFNWLETNDQCGVVQDLLDVAINNAVGTTLEDLAGYDPGNQTSTTEEEIDGDGTGRFLQFFADDTCTKFESTIFLGSMLSFTSCANVDIGKFFGTVEENIVNVGLKCLNTFLQPFKRTSTCASRNFQNYVMDECVKGVVSDDILGHIFQLFLISPKQTCSCMASLAAVPQCRVDITREVSIDGMLTSKVACLMQTQVCSKIEDECEHRLNVLNSCLPALYDINNDNFVCEEVLCNCERNDKGLLNYAGRAMDLPMSDMCTAHAVESFEGEFIPERYAVFQEKCGAKYLNEPVPPTAAPTISEAPTAVPTENVDAIANIIKQDREITDSPVNSVVSGILLALAITGIAAIFLVLILYLWRRRSQEEKVEHTIAEMKARAQDKIRRLEEEVRRWEEVEQEQESIHEGHLSI